MKKRIFSLALALAMTLSLFAGCAPKEKTSTDTDKPSENKVETKTDKKVRTDIVMAMAADAVSFDAHIGADMHSWVVNNMVYNKLIVLDENSNPTPDLAESWTIDSPTEYTFNIKKGVKFHSGEELKASDIKFSLERQLATPQSQSMIDQIKTVDIVDDYKVKITLAVPFSPILLGLAEMQSSIVSEKAVTEAEAGGKKYGEKPIGTGAMKLVDYKPNDHITLERFDDYFKGKVETTSINIRIIPEAASRVISLETGEIDFIETIPPVEVARVKGNADLKTLEVPTSIVTYVSMNQNVAPFDNVKVRQALHYATNKKSIVEAMCEGYAYTSSSVIANNVPSYDKSLESLYAFDMEKAKLLMSEAGYPDGFKAGMIPSNEERNRIAQMLQADYKQIGVDLNIEMLEWGAYLERVNTGKYDMSIGGWGMTMNVDRTMMNNFHSSKIGPAGNKIFYRNAVVDKLIEDARIETDWAKREPMYKEIQNITMRDSAWIPLYQAINVAGMAKGLDGVVFMPNGLHVYTNVVVNE